MAKPIVVKKNIRGKRNNLSAQYSVADEIVSVLSVPPEDKPLPPLSPLPPVAPRPARRRKPIGLSIAAAILLFTPFLCFAVFYFLGLILGSVLPIEILMAILIFTGNLSIFGGLLLYLAARRIQYLRMSVGWFSLLLLVFQIDFCIVFLNNDVAFIMNPAGVPTFTFAAIISTLILICMIALCVFSIMMLMRLIRKKKPISTES